MGELDQRNVVKECVSVVSRVHCDRLNLTNSATVVNIVEVVSTNDNLQGVRAQVS